MPWNNGYHRTGRLSGFGSIFVGLCRTESRPHAAVRTRDHQPLLYGFVSGYSSGATVEVREKVMSTLATPLRRAVTYTVRVNVEPALGGRNRLTTAFRFFLALPHLLLVGGPIAGVVSWTLGAPGRDQYQGGFGG